MVGKNGLLLYVVSFDVMFIWSAPQEKFEMFAISSHFRRCHTVCVMWQVYINLVHGAPEAKIDVWPAYNTPWQPAPDNPLKWDLLRLAQKIL